MATNLDLAALRVFLQVAEFAHFSRAADELGLPKGRVSQVVRELEAQLGTRLFQRTTRRVSLTSDGELLAERARGLLADAGEIEALFQQDRQLGGRLRVDLPVRLALDVLLPALPDFLAEHPGLQVELSCTDRRVDLVEEGFDCVLRVGAPRDPQVIARPIGQLEFINVASPDYLKRRGTPRTLDDLAKHDLVHYVSVLGGRSEGFEYPADGGYKLFAMPGPIVVNSTDAYHAACCAGLGLIQAPVIGVREDIERGHLVEVLPQLRPEPMPVSLLYAHRRNLPKRVRVFMDWVTEVLKPVLSAGVPLAMPVEKSY